MKTASVITSDCRRWTGKTENATRQVAIHPNLIEWGFIDFVNRQWKENILSSGG
jgi:hypothetical protein